MDEGSMDGILGGSVWNTVCGCGSVRTSVR